MTSAVAASAAGATVFGAQARAGAAPASLAPPAVAPGSAAPGTAAPLASPSTAGLFAELDEKILAGMERHAVPGAAVGVLYRGVEYLKGYGVTRVDDPVPVDPDTVFRIASTTKTFTGTTVMRLVEAGRLDLDAPVRRYLPDFRTLDESVAARVTLRQLLNHTAGWLGDDFTDTGQGDDALARFVATVAQLPQLTPPGTTFAYNNAALDVVGRVIEVVTATPYEAAVRRLLLDPLGLTHSRYLAADIAGFTVATSHNIVDGKAVPNDAFLKYPRGQNPDGGLISSVRDQLRHARFHLGDGTVPGSRRRLLSTASLRAMRSHPGPGGTLGLELDGVGVTWLLRPSAQGVRIVEHGGDEDGQHSGFMMVPDRDFAITLLTNSDGGASLVGELFTDDWALRRFAGVSNLPANPYPVGAHLLAGYEGVYTMQAVGPSGELETEELRLEASDGQLRVTVGGETAARLVFYRPDHVIVLAPEAGSGTPSRADFVRGADGRVAWLRVSGRLARRVTGSQADAGLSDAGPSDAMRKPSSTRRWRR